MACTPVTTGSQFLVSALSHLDCQAQLIGSFGFQALSAPGSPAGAFLTALLSLFIALLGFRLLFGSNEQPREWVGAVLKVGIVLTLAASWPAFRTLAYDMVLYAPAQVASTIAPDSIPGSSNGLAQRLQGLDNGMAALALTGTGRQTGAILDEGATSGFRPIALEDETGFGWSRPVFLAATIGSLATLRISAGLLLALTPLVAGLLLFETTRGIFSGWFRALVFIAIGSLSVTLLLSVQIALMEPWLADTLNRRSLGYATPTAPTELLAMILAFGLALAGMLYLLIKVSFQNAWHTGSLLHTAASRLQNALPSYTTSNSKTEQTAPHSRATTISESVASTIRREQSVAEGAQRMQRIENDKWSRLDEGSSRPSGNSIQPLGSSYRRTSGQLARSQVRRNQQA